MDKNINEIWQEYMLSKYYVAPTKRRNIAIIFLNIALFIVIIGSFMEFIFDHNVKALFGIAVPFIIVQNFKNRETSTGHYEMSGVRIELDKSKLLLKYDRQENRMEFEFSRLTSVEYSEQLEAVRIVGYENISKNVVEHVLYLERGKDQEFLDKFAEYSGLQVHNMDQKQEN